MKREDGRIVSATIREFMVTFGELEHLYTNNAIGYLCMLARNGVIIEDIDNYPNIKEAINNEVGSHSDNFS